MKFLGVTICFTTLSAMCYLFYYTECSFVLVSIFFMILMPMAMGNNLLYYPLSYVLFIYYLTEIMEKDFGQKLHPQNDSLKYQLLI
jgi:hypothetical protein